MGVGNGSNLTTSTFYLIVHLLYKVTWEIGPAERKILEVSIKRLSTVINV